MKLVLKIAAGILLALVIVIAGCSALFAQGVEEATKKQAWTVRVHAPSGAKWSGAMGGSTVDGNGSREVQIEDTSITAANAQKISPGKWELRLQLVNEDGEIVDEQNTTAAFGVVTVEGSN
jgi:hypothetical protein